MKIRQGFVSNSSSSSYTCCICGEECSGMDMCLKDAEMYECKYGHIFCESHSEATDPQYMAIQEQLDLVKQELGKEDDISYWTDSFGDVLKYETEKEIEENQLEDSLNDLIEEFFSEWRYEIPSCFCPICSMETLLHSDAAEYLMKIHNTNYDKVKKEMKARFKTYDELQEFLK